MAKYLQFSLEPEESLEHRLAKVNENKERTRDINDEDVKNGSVRILDTEDLPELIPSVLDKTRQTCNTASKFAVVSLKISLTLPTCSKELSSD